MSSPDEDVPATSAQALQATWVAELKEFELMVWSAQHGFKKFAGGADRWDMELYDLEIRACAHYRSAIEGLGIPESASAEEARCQALKALQEERASAEAGEAPHPEAQYEWARAVVEGDASRYWNHYHPRRRASPTT